MKKTIPIFALLALVIALLTPNLVLAQPYGKGIYNEIVPYGNQTSLSISTNGNIIIPVTPVSSGTLATGTSQVTVTSTDVKGYKLYIRALTSTNMNNVGSTLPASANATLLPLSVNTWGYNTDASTNFVGLGLGDTLIRSSVAPVSSGEQTTITYGIKVDLAKPAGNYVANIQYTAVPQTD